MRAAKAHEYFRKFGPFSVSSMKNLTMSDQKFAFAHCKVHLPLPEMIQRDAEYIYDLLTPPFNVVSKSTACFLLF